MHRARRRADTNQALNAVTLASIGDAVITTDAQGRVTFLNDEAERLTGWKNADAAGQPLPTVYHIINEETRATVEDAVKKVFRTGAVVGLANHTVLIARDGREFIIDDSGAPIRQGDGKIIGVVLVFRDNTEKKRAEDALRISGERLCFALETIRTGAWDLDLATHTAFRSIEHDRIFGYPELLPEWTYEKFLEHVLPEDRAAVAGKFQRALESHSDWSFECQIRRVDGEIRWIWAAGRHRQDAAGTPRHMAGIVQDITERKRVEASMLRDELFLKNTGHIAKVGGWEFDPVTGAGHWSEEVARIHDLDPNLQPTKEIGLTFYPGESRTKIEAAVKAVIEHGTPYDLELEFVSASGTHKWVRTIGQAVVENGRVVRVCGALQDVTGQKANEMRYRDQHALLRTLIDLAPDYIFVKDLDGRFMVANEALAKCYGRQPAELLSHTDADFLPPELAARFRASEIQVLAADSFVTIEDTITLLDGQPRRVVTNMMAFRNPQGKVSGLVGIGRDITKQQDAEENSAREQARLKLIFDTIPIGIAFHTVYPDGTQKRTVNEAHIRLCGLTREQHDEPEVYRKITHPDDRTVQQRFASQVDAGVIKQYSMEKRYLHPEDKVIWVNFSYQREIYPDGTTEELTTVVDITERKRLEEQLRQSQKMEAIGQLAGGVAHDFNNILAIIQLQIGLLESSGKLLPLQKDFTEEIGKATQRAANLTRQLLLFSRKQALQPQDLDLNEIVTHITKMLQRTLGEVVHLQLNYFPEPLFLRADLGMMEQILVNLAVNSRDAMPQGGRLIIETSAVVFDEATTRHSPQTRPGAFVCLSVSDTGSGIPPHILPRIFEPFFTTKDVGKGTGLGLATVFGIVQQHQGWINVSSNPGLGTTFQIYFPRLAETVSQPAATAPLMEVRGGHETILVVEDEPSLCALIHTVLTGHGYRVIEASNGESALNVWEKHRGEIQLLLTDMVLPDGMNGKELARRLRLENPRLKVIYASGYSVEVAGKDLALQEGVNFMSKPFQIHKLTQTVRNCLDSN